MFTYAANTTDLYRDLAVLTSIEERIPGRPFVLDLTHKAIRPEDTVDIPALLGRDIRSLAGVDLPARPEHMDEVFVAFEGWNCYKVPVYVRLMLTETISPAADLNHAFCGQSAESFYQYRDGFWHPTMRLIRHVRGLANHPRLIFNNPAAMGKACAARIRRCSN